MQKNNILMISMIVFIITYTFIVSIADKFLSLYPGYKAYYIIVTFILSSGIGGFFTYLITIESSKSIVSKLSMTFISKIESLKEKVSVIKKYINLNKFEDNEELKKFRTFIISEIIRDYERELSLIRNNMLKIKNHDKYLKTHFNEFIKLQKTFNELLKEPLLNNESFIEIKETVDSMINELSEQTKNIEEKK